MSEQETEGQHRQDPADPNEVDTAVDTSDQAVVPDAPVAAEPEAVEVAPVDQSELKTDSVLGKDYEVSADRGYRVVKPTQED